MTGIDPVCLRQGRKWTWISYILGFCSKHQYTKLKKKKNPLLPVWQVLLNVPFIWAYLCMSLKCKGIFPCNSILQWHPNLLSFATVSFGLWFHLFCVIQDADLNASDTHKPIPVVGHGSTGNSHKRSHEWKKKKKNLQSQFFQRSQVT